MVLFSAARFDAAWVDEAWIDEACGRFAILAAAYCVVICKGGHARDGNRFLRICLVCTCQVCICQARTRQVCIGLTCPCPAWLRCCVEAQGRGEFRQDGLGEPIAGDAAGVAMPRCH